MMRFKWAITHPDCFLTVCLQAVGDSVTEDEVVCEIETDKVRDTRSFHLENLLALPLNSQKFVCAPQTSVQVPAPAAGVIEELLVPDGGKVEGGTPLFKLRKGGEADGIMHQQAKLLKLTINQKIQVFISKFRHSVLVLPILKMFHFFGAFLGPSTLR